MQSNEQAQYFVTTGIAHSVLLHAGNILNNDLESSKETCLSQDNKLGVKGSVPRMTFVIS